MLTKLGILAVVVLGVIALAQIMRVSELSAKLKNSEPGQIPNRHNKVNAGLMLGFMIALFAGFIWLMLTYGWTGRGDAASVHGKEIDWLLNINFIIIVAVFFLTNFLLFFFAWKYVRKPGVPAFYYPHNNKLEMIWTVVPAAVLAVIIILGLKTWNEATDDAAPESIRVELFSKQFDWTARYSGADNKLGKFDYKLTTSNNELALITSPTLVEAVNTMQADIDKLEKTLNDQHLMLTPKDREAKMTDLSRKENLIRLLIQMQKRHDAKLDALAWDDIIQKDTLYLCKGKEYEFNFRSKDVIHSAYFPHFRAQMNTVPGMTTRFKFIPDMTTAEMRIQKNNEDFNYVLMCNKICGGAHYKMKMMVVVLEEKAYDKWMASKATSTFKDKYMAATVEETQEETPSMEPVHHESTEEGHSEEGNEEVHEEPAHAEGH